MKIIKEMKERLDHSVGFAKNVFNNSFKKVIANACKKTT